MKRVKLTLKGYLVTGLLIWVPLAITFWVLDIIIGTMDETLYLLPESIRPESLFGFHVPGAGVLVALAVILGTGALPPTCSDSALWPCGMRCCRAFRW